MSKRRSINSPDQSNIYQVSIFDAIAEAEVKPEPMILGLQYWGIRDGVEFFLTREDAELSQHSAIKGTPYLRDNNLIVFIRLYDN